ncbi:MAG TPA: hypothetical protein VGM83_18960 [Devosiaceae bacterium]|jgi:hypothetical protein
MIDTARTLGPSGGCGLCGGTPAISVLSKWRCQDRFDRGIAGKADTSSKTGQMKNTLSQQRWPILAAITLVAGMGPGGAVAAPAGDGAANYYADRSWGDFNGGSVHISSFIFSDRNGDGAYGMEDAPLADIMVQLTNPANGLSLQRSNLSGFANFDASLLGKNAPITTPGTYEFQIIPPPGWRITTGNAVQRIPVEILKGAPGDLVATKLTVPVGLAPLGEIRGRVRRPAGGEAVTIVAAGPLAEKHLIAVAADGSYAIPAAPGKWSVKVAGKGIHDTEHPVDVGYYPVDLPLLPSPVAANAPGRREVITFDDLISGQTVGEIPNGYEGLDWHNWVATHNLVYGGEGYRNGTVSGTYVAYGGSGHPATIESREPFDFAGGYFSAAWPGAQGETLIVRAWRADVLVHEDRLLLSVLGPVYFAADYQHITRLEVATEHYWQFVADDLTFSTPPQF